MLNRIDDHVIYHTSQVTRHKSHVTRHKSQVTSHTSPEPDIKHGVGSHCACEEHFEARRLIPKHSQSN